MFDIRPMMPASVIADREDPLASTDGPAVIEVVIPWRSTKAYDREAYDKGTRVAVRTCPTTRLSWSGSKQVDTCRRRWPCS
jgi:hypothetical protein